MYVRNIYTLYGRDEMVHFQDSQVSAPSHKPYILVNPTAVVAELVYAVCSIDTWGLEMELVR